MRTGTASGIQIAFLIFAVALTAVPLSDYINEVLATNADQADVVNRTLHFALAALVIVTFPALRHQVASELSRPVLGGGGVEVAAVALAKVPMMVGVFAAIALWTWMSKGPSALEHLMEYSSATEATKAFSSYEIYRSLILGGLIAPVVEEIVFRGLLYRTWEKRWGWIPSAFMVSVLFGLYHPYSIAAFVSSLIFIAVLRRTGSLWGPIAVHGFANAMTWYPFAGQLSKPAADTALGDIGNWGPQLACLLFASIAVPAYLVIAAREDVRDRDE